MDSVPSKKQLEFLDWEFGVFFHFGIRSCFPGHKDWDGRPMPASAFNPVRLDCGQWIRTAKRAGAKYAILVTKHHDGFANWPSRYSDYSVAQTPWQDGKGDVVREFTDACRKYGVKVGLYYSPAQWGGTVHFDAPREYDDYFINQITELLTNYGQIDYLWFDGCGSENHEYDRDRIVNVIRTLQPEIRIFSMWDPDTRWVGNEDGYADMPNENEVSSAEFSIRTSEQIDVGGRRYLPAECDMMMRNGTWFDCEANADTVKSVKELLGHYEYTVGRGANLLLNVGPNAEGLLPPEDAKRLEEFGEAVRARYGYPLPFGAPVQGDENTYEITAEDAPETDWNVACVGARPVNAVVLQEDLTKGQKIRSFRIYACLPRYSSKYVCVYKGDTVGHKAICRFPTVLTGKLRFRAEESDGPVSLKAFSAFDVSE